MSDANGTKAVVTAALDQAVEGVAVVLLDLRERVAIQEADLAEIRAEAKRLNSALRSLAPDHPAVESHGNAKQAKAKVKGSTAGKPGDWNLQPDKAEAVWAYMLAEHGGGEAFTLSSVIRHFEGDISHQTIRRVADFLRSHEALRRAGMLSLTSAKGKAAGTAQAFKVQDADAGHAALKANRETVEAGTHGGPRTVAAS